MTTVHTFSHLGANYSIVETSSFPWRKAFGFKPKQPYILCNASGFGINGVSESDLAWYRAQRCEPVVKAEV